MFNRQIEITRENESILFINAVIENLRYGIISLDRMFSGKTLEDYYNNYYDEHTFYFFHMQSVLTAQGNIHNVLFYNYFAQKRICQARVKKVRDACGIDLSKYPLVGNKDYRNSNAHFDERYYCFDVVGDMNLLKKDTPKRVRNTILSKKSPHLRTLDIENWLYITYDKYGNRIVLDLQKLRNEMYSMLDELCSCDIRDILNAKEHEC